jgi:hypothetical protein
MAGEETGTEPDAPENAVPEAPLQFFPIIPYSVLPRAAFPPLASQISNPASC